MQTPFYQHALTRLPPASMAQGITTQSEKVDLESARQQHADYVNALQQLGLSVDVLTPEEHYPDSHFVEDAAIIYNNTAILTCPGADERQGEVEAITPQLKKRFPIRTFDDPDARVDGGDVLFMGDHVYIGTSYRTNIAGAKALSKILLSLNPSLDIHAIPFDGVLHLKSGFTAIGPNLLLGHPGIKLKNPLPHAEVIWVPEKESYAANALALNDHALVFAECKKTQALISDSGLTPVPLDMSEFRKMDGSFTCLSLLW